MHSLVPNSNSVFKIGSLVDLISSLMKLLWQKRVQAAINQVAFLMLYHVLSFHKLWKSSFTKCEIQEKQYFIEQEGKFSRRPAARSYEVSSIVLVNVFGVWLLRLFTCHSWSLVKDGNWKQLVTGHLWSLSKIITVHRR